MHVKKVLFHLMGAAFVLAKPVVAEDAHVHGEATLEVSVAAGQLQVALRGPAQVFFGFEHPPETDEEVAVVASALAALRTPEKVFATVGGACVVSAVVVDSPFSAHSEKPHDDHGGAEDHVHNAHEGESDEQTQHVDLGAEYTLDCNDKRPRELEVKAFTVFPELEKLEAAWIDETGGGSALLTARSTTLSLQNP